MLKFLKKFFLNKEEEEETFESLLQNKEEWSIIVSKIESNPSIIEKENPFHTLCRYASVYSDFKSAWEYFVEKKIDYTELNKNLYNSLQILIINNPEFFSPGPKGELKPSQLFDYLVPKYFSFKDLPYPYGKCNPFFFFKDYSHIFLDFKERQKEPLIAFQKYQERSLWVEVPIDLAIKESIILTATDINEISLNIMGKSCPSFRKFCDNLINSVDSEIDFKNMIHHLNEIRMLAKLPYTEDQIITIVKYCMDNNLFSKIRSDNRYLYRNEEKPFDYFSKNLSFKKFLKLFIETYYQPGHTQRMLCQLQDNDIFIDYRDFKTGKELHDYCSMEVSKVNTEKLRQQLSKFQEGIVFYKKRIQDLDGVVLGSYSFKIPSSGNDLIIWGGLLKICVGSMYYCERLSKGEIFIVLIYKNGEPYGCCHCDSQGSIVEIKSKYNNPMEEEVSSYLRKALIKQLSE